MANDTAKDIMLSVLPSPQAPEQESERQRLILVVNKIAAIPDDEINSYPIVTNEDRPHSAIGYNVPIALHSLGGAISPSP